MPESTSTYIGLACAALVIASFVPGLSDAAASRDEVHGAGARRQAAAKGDMLDVYRPVARAEVAATALEGEPGRSAIWMRTRTGQVAYRADADEAVTAAAKNVVLPPLPERMAQRPALEAAAPVRAPARVMARSAIPVGCERVVSVLVKSAERDRIGRCLS